MLQLAVSANAPTQQLESRCTSSPRDAEPLVQLPQGALCPEGTEDTTSRSRPFALARSKTAGSIMWDKLKCQAKSQKELLGLDAPSGWMASTTASDNINDVQHYSATIASDNTNDAHIQDSSSISRELSSPQLQSIVSNFEQQCVDSRYRLAASPSHQAQSGHENRTVVLIPIDSRSFAPHFSSMKASLNSRYPPSQENTLQIQGRPQLFQTWTCDYVQHHEKDDY